ncbi:PAS domain S-box protein [Geomonas anaerohicana]|uniref:histidine kinase n=1 Tax=Geomonas anaerohicana TaxID=2798583 RepID=A0ABS0YHN8_9BACT|nr:PAS domain S-box protein [Geomonas anaerohicana]MBJ6751843.1 PAS domain S-box protein [Geomonas anaerohicana]
MGPAPTKNLKVVPALLLPFLACALQLLLWDYLQPFAYILFYPAVFLSSRLAGKRAGIAATAISALLIVYVFIPPPFSLLSYRLSHLASVFVFIVMGTLFAHLHERLQTALNGETDARAEANSSEAKLAEARIDLLELERKLVQERLAETEEQFRIMFMESSVGEARLDPASGRLLKVNPAFCRMTGYKEGELLDMDLVAVCHPEDRQPCRESLASLGESGRSGVQAEFALLRRDGASVYCQATFNLLRGGAGGTSVLAVLQDVSARRQAEEALLKSEEKFSLAFSGNPAAIALTRFEDGAFLEVNETWEALTGYSREEAIGRSGRHIWPDPSAVERFLAQLRDTGTLRGWEQEFNRKNGERFVAQLSSQLLSVGGEQVILSTLVDITQLKLAEAALRDSENRFRTIFDHAPVAIGIGAVDDGRLLNVNPAWLRLMGFQREEVIGRTALELGLYLDDGTRDEIVAAIRQGKGFSQELQLKRKSGEVIDVLFAADVVVLDGTPCLLVMLNDVTVQKQAERALQKSKQDYQQLFQNMLEGVASCRVVRDAAGAVVDFVFLNVNRALLQLTGRDDLVGRRASQVIARLSESNAGLLAACGRVAQTGLSEHLETFIVPLDQWWAVSLYSVEPGYFVALCDNITVRKREEMRRNATVELLRICNESTDLKELMSRTARFFRDLTGCRGIGIRLRSGEGYPYYESIGLPDEESGAGDSLCDRVARGIAPPEAADGAALRCLCAEVLAGRVAGEGRGQGSYWTSTGVGAARGADVVAGGAGEQQRGAATACHAESFQSLALIPLRSHGEMIGLFQFSDPAPGLMSAEKVALYEDLVDYIAISFSKLRADQALLEASQYNQQIIAGAQEGIIVYDRQLRCQVWNPYMEQFTGLGAGEMLGRRPQEVIPALKESGVVALLARSLEGEESSPVDFRFSVEQTGRSGWVTDTRAPLKDVQGNIIGVITTVRDITAERRLEEQLRQAQKMEAVGLLAGGVAHDFNNVLQVIMGYCSLLAADPKLDDEQKGEVEQILVSAERAAQLTKGLLAFSRKQVMEPRRVNLCDIVQHVQKFLVRIIGEDITLKVVQCPKPELPVIADSGHIEQVLINLATNARDAMAKGGTLTVGMEVVQVEGATETEFGHAEPGSYACVIMSDTGCGMDEETRGRIFEPFFTTKEVGKGTGLGMAIVYGIVKQHAGFINVYSEPGVGTTFRVYLPLAKDDGTQAAGPVELPPPRGGTETLLLAEDDTEVRKLMVTILTRFGYTVVEAADGQQAVELFAAHQDSIALVVMDLIMPRKNGMDAGLEIVQMKPGTKILYSSGYTADFMERRGIFDQGIQLIMKPVQPVQLLRKVREMLDG